MHTTTRLLFALVLFCGSTAFAQVGEDARVSARSDVKMSIEGDVGMGGGNIEALARHLGVPLGDVKHCYGEIVKKHPEITGSIVVELFLAEGKKTVFPKIAGGQGIHPKVKRCVDAAFRRVVAHDVARPAKARVVLEFTNSSAKGAEEVKVLEEEEARVDVRTAADGSYFAEGKSTHGEVFFTVSARGNRGAALVEEGFNGVRDSLPSLFDCRRKAGKRESPEGELNVVVVLAGKAKASAKVTETTVKSEWTPSCVQRALSRGLAGRGHGRIQVVVRFAP